MAAVNGFDLRVTRGGGWRTVNGIRSAWSLWWVMSAQRKASLCSGATASEEGASFGMTEHWAYPWPG